MELTDVNHHGLAAAVFALMYAIGNSTTALLGAVHPFWRLNMLAMASVALMTLTMVAILLPEPPMWLLSKDKEAEAEASLRRIRGDTEFINEFMFMKFAHMKMIEQTESKQNRGNTEVVTQKRRLPRPPTSFAFLFILNACIGWSGLAYIALNGPKIFQVKNTI